MPEIGFDDEPICPVMRLETVTKKKPNSSDQDRRREVEPRPGRDRDRTTAITTEPPMTIVDQQIALVRSKLAASRRLPGLEVLPWPPGTR